MKNKKGLRRFFTLNVHNHEGFTLVELIVVIAILAILAGVAVPVYSGYVKRANKSADDALIHEINLAFQSACLNNRYDVSSVTAASIDDSFVVSGVTISGADEAVTDQIAADFNNTFFTVANPVLKYYKYIQFIQSGSKFVGKVDNFNPEVMGGIEDAFNKISAVLKGYDELTADEIRKAILGDFDDNLAKALGMEGMLEGYLAATELEGDNLKAALEKYCPDYVNAADKDAWIAANGETIAKLKANLGVMHFATAAKTDDPEQLKTDVMGSLDTILSAVYTSPDVDVDEDAVWEYYKTTARGEAKIAEVGEAAARAGDFVDFRGYSYMLGMTGDDLVRISTAIGTDAENEAGINTLGALYALSAGFYNSDYFEGDEHGEFGDFPTVVQAITDPNFQKYYEEQAGADIDAYLEQMRDLSSQENLDLTDPNVFTGVFTGGSN